MGSVNFLERHKQKEQFEDFLLRRQEYRDKSRRIIWPPSPRENDELSDHKRSNRSSNNSNNESFISLDPSSECSEASDFSQSISSDSELSHETVSKNCKKRKSSNHSERNSKSTGSQGKHHHRRKDKLSDSKPRHKTRRRSKHSKDDRSDHRSSKKHKINSSQSTSEDKCRNLRESPDSKNAELSFRSPLAPSNTITRTETSRVKESDSNLYSNNSPSFLPDAPVGPVPLKIVEEKATERTYGEALLAGEGFAMAAYIQSGKRIPRRGEIGLTSEEIKAYEDVGFVMSGSRHRRMNAVRIRKENQVISAEEKRALLILNRETNIKKENEIIANLKDMVQEKLRGKMYQD